MELKQKINDLAKLRMEAELLANRIKQTQLEVYTEMLACDIQTEETPFGKFIRKPTRVWTYPEHISNSIESIDTEIKVLKDKQKAIEIKAQKEEEATCEETFSYSFTPTKF